MIQFLSKEQISNKIQELSKKVKKRMYICSPYVHSFGYMVLDNKACKNRQITKRFIVNDKSSDRETLTVLCKWGKVRTNYTFHAKVYILDNVILIGSANLTIRGLNSNLETMLCTNNNHVVNSAVEFFEQLWKEKESKKVTPETIRKMKPRKSGSAGHQRGTDDSGIIGPPFMKPPIWDDNTQRPHKKKVKYPKKHRRQKERISLPNKIKQIKNHVIQGKIEELLNENNFGDPRNNYGRLMNSPKRTKCMYIIIIPNCAAFCWNPDGILIPSMWTRTKPEKEHYRLILSDEVEKFISVQKLEECGFKEIPTEDIPPKNFYRYPLNHKTSHNRIVKIAQLLKNIRNESRK